MRSWSGEKSDRYASNLGRLRNLRAIRILFGGTLVYLLLVSPPSQAQEAILNDRPVTPSVAEEPVSIKPTLDERIGIGVLTPYLHELANLPPVIRHLYVGWSTRS